MPEQGKVFVFGSNHAGVHGAGAALYAKKNHGAEQGVGVGMTGNAYAIPTKQSPYKTFPLRVINCYVKAFIEFAENNPDKEFYVTRIGCGLAGYTDDQIGPMFKKAPSNCELPEEWEKYRNA